MEGSMRFVAFPAEVLYPGGGNKRQYDHFQVDEGLKTAKTAKTAAYAFVADECPDPQCDGMSNLAPNLFEIFEPYFIVEYNDENAVEKLPYMK
ncbi:hypothetical protein ACFOQM_02030 [Paenibacillus sp. GCM10012307]|uniref:Uncharacterized protein n=1 Tax=Paenibacillus roseus TaxID=2798579 RepID=A0A934J4D3_9BACL|nr:hypothetical protein [Paenibacillus roseus]MBJ6360097.1 hypothetical protein [Paenibacillus roseus]